MRRDYRTHYEPIRFFSTSMHDQNFNTHKVFDMNVSAKIRTCSYQLNTQTSKRDIAIMFGNGEQLVVPVQFTEQPAIRPSECARLGGLSDTQPSPFGWPRS